MTEPSGTTPQQLIRAAEIGGEEGLRFVYAGNLPGRVGEWEHTRCLGCQQTLVERFGFQVRANRVLPSGKCSFCGTTIPGVWGGHA